MSLKKKKKSILDQCSETSIKKPFYIIGIHSKIFLFSEIFLGSSIEPVFITSCKGAANG